MSNLNSEQIEAIRLRLIDFCKTRPEVSNKDIGQNTGYSPGYINLFMHGKFPSQKTLPEVASKIENYLNNQLAIQEPANNTELKFALTKAAEDIFKTIDYSLTRSVIGLVTGMPGYGKTITLKEYCKRNPTALLIEVTPLVTQKSLLRDVAQSLKIPINYYKENSKVPVGYSKDVLFHAIIDKVRNTNRILIIDEGENLTVQCLEIVRRIQDLSKIGMLLSGTARLRSRLRGERQELQQLFSRVGIQTEIDKMQLTDVKAILQINFPEAVKYAHNFVSLSKNNGRLLKHLIALVKKTIQETGGPISEDVIDDAAESLLM